jgi:hypothetical protein
MTRIPPPLKRDWKPGATQLGLFIRFPDGSTMEITENDSPEDASKAATDLLILMARPRKTP